MSYSTSFTLNRYLFRYSLPSIDILFDFLDLYPQQMSYLMLFTLNLYLFRCSLPLQDILFDVLYPQ